MMFTTNSITVEIVHQLEEHGIDLEPKTLHDYVDPDALEEVVSTGEASIEIRITIEGVQFSITRHGVQPLN